MNHTKISPEQRREIFELYEKGTFLNYDIAKKYNVQSTYIRHIAKMVREEMEQAKTEVKTRQNII